VLKSSPTRSCNRWGRVKSRMISRLKARFTSVRMEFSTVLPAWYSACKRLAASFSCAGLEDSLTSWRRCSVVRT
jgi:hypothetical protein